MPIVTPNSNQRIAPQNARSGDVARATLDAVIPAQNRKYHEAFRVNGYPGILYQYLTSGLRCACQSKSRAINSRLDETGKASPGAINEMIFGTSFGLGAYGSSKTNTPSYEQSRTEGHNLLEVTVDPRNRVPLSTPTHPGPLRVGGLPPVVGNKTSLEENHVDLVEDEDADGNLDNFESDLDSGSIDYSGVSCPVCFGSGYVGGFSVMNGYRRVLNFQDPTLDLPADAVIAVEQRIPSIHTSSVAWTVMFPSSCVTLDAFRIWNDTNMVVPGTIRIDNTVITSAAAVSTYCDGRPHEVSFEWPSEVDFTHFEFQVNLSTEEVLFELPRLSKSSVQNLREATNPFSVNLSPVVPYIKALDVIVESTFGKALHVKDVTGWNEKRNSTLGWDVEVRPTQPQELFRMLPRRKPLATMNKKSIVSGMTGTKVLATS